ncbi:MAG: DUF4956 domain-containing protein [Ruminococcaceae bacterium]|nr:DUF4956 domain-containing protein [Oscillospiraceae bacterium]
MNELFKRFGDVNVNQPLTLERIFLTFAVTLVLALVMILVYRITYQGVLFNKTFTTALLMVSMVTALVIMPISSNIVLSLGMVGALSIVRFRTALKDPLDIVYMFWGIAIGLTAGAAFYLLAIIGTVVLALVMIGTALFPQFSSRKAYLLVIRYNREFRGELQKLIPPYRVKSKTVTPQSVELIVELSIKNQESRFLERLQQMEGIISASLVRYSGDF